MHRDCEPGEAMLLVQGKLERHSCTVSEDVSCHAVDLYEQEARLEDIAFVAIQQAETAWSLEPTSVQWYHIAPPDRSLGTKGNTAACDHMYNAFTGLAASSARTRQHRCSQVSNNEASVFPRQTLIRAKMASPHSIVVDPGVDSRHRSLHNRSFGRQRSINTE
jgi:hypothetical protein